MKKFKSKKKRKFKWRIIIYLIIVFVSYELSFSLIAKTKIVSSNENFIKCMLADSNYHLLYQQNASTLINKLTTVLTDLNINEPITILENSTHYVMKDNKVFKYAENDISVSPLVYIYNSHQKESYAGEGLKQYNIDPNVLMASYLLKEKLKENNIESIVLEDSIYDYINLNNMQYKDSYKASRFFLQKAMEEHKSIRLYIDLHRDSLKKEKTTVTINNKNYAKMIFIVGLDNDKYEENLNIANKLNGYLSKYEGLSKGILKKSGNDVNGIYNQDLSPNMILIEVGGYENTIDEVLNTVDVFADIIGEYLNEK